MKTGIRYNKKIRAEVKCDIIKLPIYRCDVVVFLPPNNEKLNKYGGWELAGMAGGVYDYLKESSEVWVRFNELDNDVIAHEVNHIVTHILHSRGHDFNKPYDEPMAYLTGYLVGEIHKLAKKHKLRVKWKN
jgi:hypothetical protein